MTSLKQRLTSWVQGHQIGWSKENKQHNWWHRIQAYAKSIFWLWKIETSMKDWLVSRLKKLQKIASVAVVWSLWTLLSHMWTKETPCPHLNFSSTQFRQCLTNYFALGTLLSSELEENQTTDRTSSANLLQLQLSRGCSGRIANAHKSKTEKRKRKTLKQLP